jgi:hypothetical protein
MARKKINASETASKLAKIALRDWSDSLSPSKRREFKPPSGG